MIPKCRFVHQPDLANLDDQRKLASHDDREDCTTALAMMGTLTVHVHSVDGCAGRHEQAITFSSAKADVAADFWEMNLTDSRPVFGREDVHPVVTFTDPARTCPDVSMDVATNAVREAGFC